MKRRVPASRFNLPADKIRQSWYTDKYFSRSRDILLADQHTPKVLMQVFCRSHAVACGLDEAIGILQCGSLDSNDLTVHALHDGDMIAPWETVMTIEGPYPAFAHLETLYLGVLSRGTRIASHTRDIVNAANEIDVLFFGARHDHFLTQQSDGYAALIGGASSVATDAHGSIQERIGVGTIPHALIAAYHGDSLRAAQKFVEYTPSDVDLIALVDFDNDCVGTSIAIARDLGAQLKGVRLDTSAALVDTSLLGTPDERPGVNPALVRQVRQALDEAGYSHVKIIVSGGINARRINEFRAADSPVDGFGVGSSILSNEGRFDFTADIVQVDGKPVAKVGREFRPNERLSEVTL